MWEEIAVENGRISDFQGLVTLTLDRVILHTVMHHSSTSTDRPNFIEIDETFCGRTCGRTYERRPPEGRTFETDCIGQHGGVDQIMPLPTLSDGEGIQNEYENYELAAIRSHETHLCIQVNRGSRKRRVCRGKWLHSDTDLTHIRPSPRHTRLPRNPPHICSQICTENKGGS